MRAIGFVLLGAGLSWLLYALNIDTSVQLPYGAGWPGRVQNLSLMEQRRTHLMLSGGAIVVGVLLLGFGRLQRAEGDSEDGADDYRQCPFCAEPVRMEAVICKHCRCELPTVSAEDDIDDAADEAEVVDDAPEPDDGVRYTYRELARAAEEADRH